MLVVFLPTAFVQYLSYTEMSFWNPCPPPRTRRTPWPPWGRTILFKNHAPGADTTAPTRILSQLQFVFAASLD